MADELIEAAAILFTRTADLEDNRQQIVGSMEVGARSNVGNQRLEAVSF